MRDDFPFTREQLDALHRDKLIKLAKYCGIEVHRDHTNQKIIDKLWDKYYPEVLICDSSKYPVRCRRFLNEEGDEIIVYKDQEYNLSRMGERVKRILDFRIREGL
jgi:thymidine kinase